MAQPSDTTASRTGTGGAAVERALLLVLGVLALVCFNCPGTEDVSHFFLPFYENMKGLGVIAGYRFTVVDYPPFSHALVLYSGWIAEALGATPLTGLKGCLLLFSALSAVVFRRCWGGGLPLILFLGVAVVNGMMLGYLDTCYTPTLLLSLWALRRRSLAWFSVLFVVSFFVKWQPLIFAPFCGWHALRRADAQPGDGLAFDWRRAAWTGLPGTVVAGLVLLVFGKALASALGTALTDDLLSGRALNANWVATCLFCWRHPGAFTMPSEGTVDCIYLSQIHGWARVPKVLFIGVYLLTLWRFGRGVNSFTEFLRASLLGFLGYCVFNTGVHENHFYIPVVLACLLASVDARATVQAVLVAAMALINLVLFYGFNGSSLGFSRVVGVDLSFPLALGYVALYLWWWIGWLREKTPPRAAPEMAEAPGLASRPAHP